MFIVVAPSGAGKSSFVERIIRDIPKVKDVVTYTTRAQRKGEVNGLTYHFVSDDEFTRLIETDFFVEWAKVHTKRYGTPLDQILREWNQGHAVIMDIDIQGAATLKARFPQAKTIFILPPSIEELRRRIIGRDGKVPLDLEIRLSNAQKEMAVAHTADYQVVNDKFEDSYAQFKKIIEELLSAV